MGATPLALTQEFVTYLEEKKREWGGRDQFKWGTRRAPAAYIKLA